MFQWIWENKEWVFGGIGIAIISGIVGGIKWWKSRVKKQGKLPGDRDLSLDELKSKTHILFVDDDQGFRVVELLSKSGWRNTITLRDIDTLDSSFVTGTHIFFIDIHGVGKSLAFRDEGLGLAVAIKEKYPEKKVVIYSVQTQGDRFHKALQMADRSLRKDADPYQFQQCTEQLAHDYWRERATVQNT